MGSPPIVRRRDTLRRRPGELSGIGTFLQARTELSIQAASGVVESLEKRREHKSLHHSIVKRNISCGCLRKMRRAHHLWPSPHHPHWRQW